MLPFALPELLFAFKQKVPTREPLFVLLPALATCQPKPDNADTALYT